MKRFAAALFVLGLAVPNVYATCPSAQSGPYEAGGRYWYNWSPDPSCQTTSNVSSGTLSCYSYAANVVALQASSFVRYTFTADQVYSTWEGGAYVDFDDPNNSSANWIDAWAYVTHNNVTTPHHLFSHDGTQGDMSCAHPYGTFSAADGDTVVVEIQAYRANSNTTIKIGDLKIYNTQ
ncbi:MAG TPA: hypothetical protein VE010_01085 [Thermoanaerobaculia bacterium]|nr:hypothetical protein [Thermoanaerobaculia bacterium]